MEFSGQFLTPLPLYPPGKSPRYPVGEPQGQSGHCGEEKNLLPLAGIEPLLSSP
jgi:hypothetical protein